jgi:hypothetical protein
MRGWLRLDEDGTPEEVVWNATKDEAIDVLGEFRIVRCVIEYERPKVKRGR